MQFDSFMNNYFKIYCDSVLLKFFEERGFAKKQNCHLKTFTLPINKTSYDSVLVCVGQIITSIYFFYFRPT